jgi:hypothetical protein
MVMCDVHVEQLRDKRRQWIDCIDGDDDNSIFNQLTRMTGNITAFRVLMEEAFDRAPDAEEGGKQVNWLLVDLLKESFLTSLLLGLRRLMGKEGLDGKRGVYSLCSLVTDIRDNSHLLTRDAIIRLGPPPENMNDGNHGEIFRQDWTCTKNGLIDELSGVAEDERSPGDRIPRNAFDTRLKNLAKGFEKAENLINKEIAHAATPESRRRSNYQGICWGDLYEFHGELCKTAHFVQDITSEAGMNSFLPVFQGDEFQYLSQPIVAEKDLQRLANRWAELQTEYESWRKWRPRPAPRHELDADDSHEWAKIHARYKSVGKSGGP